LKIHQAKIENMQGIIVILLAWRHLTHPPTFLFPFSFFFSHQARTPYPREVKKKKKKKKKKKTLVA
jgi:hypothetical protein